MPDDLAAAATELRQAAVDADEHAIRCRAEAEAVVAAAQADADRIIREGHAKALPLIAEANTAERKAAQLGGRSKHHEHAARQEALTEEDEAKVAGLTAERERLTETIAGLDGTLAELAAERERLEAERAAARSAGNVRTVGDLVPLVEATDETAADLTGQHERAQARPFRSATGPRPDPANCSTPSRRPRRTGEPSRWR